MSAHSPAPWSWTIPGPMNEDTFEQPEIPVDWETWKSTGYCDNPRLFAANGEDIISAGAGEYTPVHGITREQRAANARLIEASPRLLAALVELVARCDGAEGVRADGSNIQTMAAHAAIAAARGEA